MEDFPPSHPPTPAHSSLAPWCLGGAPSQCDSLGNGHWSPNWPFDLELKTQELVLLQQHHHRTNAHLQRKIRTHTHKCPISRNCGLITIFTSCNRNMRNQFLERLYSHTLNICLINIIYLFKFVLTWSPHSIRDFSFERHEETSQMCNYRLRLLNKSNHMNGGSKRKLVC